MKNLLFLLAGLALVLGGCHKQDDGDEDRIESLEITDAAAGLNVVDVTTPAVFNLSQSNVSNLTIVKPEGWDAVVSGDVLTVTAPDPSNPHAEGIGTLTLIGQGASGEAATASMTVGAWVAYTPGDGSFLDILVQTPGLAIDTSYGRDVLLDDDGDGLILLSDAARVKQIDVSGQSLGSLPGLEYFPALEHLNCADNALTGTLDVSGLTKLGYLNCSGTNLSTLDVSGLTNLHRLDCYNNDLSSLNVSDCTSLKILYCFDTDLATLDVSGCTNLEILDCYNNDLSTLDVSGLTNLEYLHCSKTNLSTLNVSDCTSLETLYCFDTDLATLDVSGLTNLRYLYCYNNSLDELDVSGCVNLQELWCSNSFNLSELDVSGCTSLEKLECSFNSLSTLNVSGCTSLEILECYHNDLSTLDVSGCTSLEKLDCRYNDLSTLDVSGCVNLQRLWCIDNKLAGTLDVSDCASSLSLSCFGNPGLTKIWHSAAQAGAARYWDVGGVVDVEVKPYHI